jgi:hypothetical protein
MAEYVSAWRKLARIRRTAAVAVLVLLTWAVIEFRIDPECIVTRQLVVTFLLCVAFWSYAIPRCGQPFQAGFVQGPWTAWPRKEYRHCGLPVGS